MSMYAVKNGKGEFALIDMDELTWDTGFATLWFGVNEPYAKRTADDYGGHVVELIEKPEPVVVSEEEAEMLKKAKDTTVWRPAAVISDYAYNAVKDSAQMALLEDRLLRAYVNGWEVEKPKRWYVKVPHTTDELYWKRGNGNIGCVGAWQNDDEIVRNRAFTLAEIEHYGLQDCEKVEVKD